MAARETHAAYTALITALKGINGSTGGYWLNLQGRVYERLRVPEEQGTRGMPFISAPVAFDTPSFAHEEKRIVITWTQWIHLFVPEKASDKRKSTSALLSLKGRSDVMRALLLSKTPGGFLTDTVDDLSFLSGGGIFGAIDADDTYAEVVVPVELTLGFAVGEIGSSA